MDTENYILLVIQNGSIPRMTTYDSWNAVTAAYHQELAYRHESRTKTVCVIFNYEGSELKRDVYIA